MSTPSGLDDMRLLQLTAMFALSGLALLDMVAFLLLLSPSPLPLPMAEDDRGLPRSLALAPRTSAPSPSGSPPTSFSRCAKAASREISPSLSACDSCRDESRSRALMFSRRIATSSRERTLVPPPRRA